MSSGNPKDSGWIRGWISILYDRFLQLPRSTKQAVLLANDLLAIPLALWLAMVFRLGTTDFTIEPGLQAVCAITVLVSAITFLRLGLYRAVIRFMGQQAVIAVIKGVTISALVVAVAAFTTRTFMPRSVPFIYWSLLLIAAGGSRLLLRSWYQQRVREGSKRVAIYGAGEAGRELQHALLQGGEYLPVVFVDDNDALQGTVINGTPVISPQRLQNTLQREKVTEVFLALASIGVMRRREIINSLVELPVYVRTIPSFSDLVNGRAGIDEVRDITLEELLGRESVPPHPRLLEQAIGDKKVLVTGAGGSIGSELCRQILSAAPEELILFDSSEYALYKIERELRTRAVQLGRPVSIVPLLGSVQDGDRLKTIMKSFAVKTVFHAAAYKHVPLVEHNVVEGVLNNVFGTERTARAAMQAGVESFVLISSDKAVRPGSVMGASKRMAELLLQALETESAVTRFRIVRFGNVLGSSGSVVPLFREQIAAGGPVTVTHNDMVRYFMTITEAAQLVLQATSLGNGGEVFVLDMGQPIRISDLARRMIRLMGFEPKDEDTPQGDIEIRYTGMRPGEKLSEELLLGDRVDETGHPMISRALEESLSRDEVREVLTRLRSACRQFDCDQIREIFGLFISGFHSDHACVDEIAARHEADEPVADAKVTRLVPR